MKKGLHKNTIMLDVNCPILQTMLFATGRLQVLPMLPACFLASQGHCLSVQHCHETPLQSLQFSLSLWVSCLVSVVTIAITYLPSQSLQFSTCFWLILHPMCLILGIVIVACKNRVNPPRLKVGILSQSSGLLLDHHSHISDCLILWYCIHHHH